jgi:hypothetical protein
LSQPGKQEPVITTLATFGAAFFLESLVLTNYGQNAIVRQPFQMFWTVVGIRISPQVAINMAVALGILGILSSVLYASPFGRATRASAIDPIGASLAGVPGRTVWFTIYVLGGLLAGVAGVLIMNTAGMDYSQGLGFTLGAFGAAILFGLIPTALAIDTRPLASADGRDAFWIGDEEVPGLFASCDDVVVAVPDEPAELIGPQIVPDVFHRVQLWRIGWQGQQGNVVRYAQCPALLVLPGSVADQPCVGARSDLSADLLQMFVHGLDIDGGHDDGGADAAGRADRAEQMDGVMTVVAHHRRARADRCPDIGDRALLADPGFILKPYLDRLAGGRSRQCLAYQGSEVF